MRVLVYPHEMAIGGSQINAIDLAAEMRDLGHEAIIYSQPGPLVDYVVDEKGLPFVAAHQLRYRPGPTRIAQLARLARRERIDIIHAYEWPPCLDAYYGAHLMASVPVVCTVLSMGFTPLIPTTVPLLMGTHELAADVERQWDGQVGVMEPPIDTVTDDPRNDGGEFRRKHGVGDDELLVVSVSRLSVDLKLDALKDVIDGVGAVADRFPIRLILVGDGDASAELKRRAAAVNAAAGRTVIELPGAMLDPRPAYAAADIVAGMGSSALRAMAHGKPVVVQGERGFAKTFDDDTAPEFLWAGFYGLGPGGSAADQVASELEGLLGDPHRRDRLGCRGREIVVERFSLRAAAGRLIELYDQTLASPSTRRADWSQAAVIGGRAAVNELRLHDPRDKSRRHADRQASLADAALAPPPESDSLAPA
jgi:glycosyltransferase involved in cell wall biosynthesis